MRLPFTTVAVVPFGVGIYLASQTGRPFSWVPALMGIVAVFAICVGCHLFGEVHDQKEDSLTKQFGRSKFAGGTLMVTDGILEARKVAAVAWGAFGLAAILGVGITVWHRSLALLALGTFGALCAALYSIPPVRFASRGVGEILIGICYGWLPVVTGYGSAVGTLPEGALLPSLPMAASIFAVILINEFPDYEPDKLAGKRNLLQRIGKEAGAYVYLAAMLVVVAAALGTWWTYRQGDAARLVAAMVPSLLALGLGIAVARGAWRVPARLEVVCALTILLNHASSLGVAALVRWS